jgi:curli biogenesis system outer membrane secretion channel CsgG
MLLEPIKGLDVKPLQSIILLLLITCICACVPLNLDQHKYKKPRVAILDFENKASMSSRWKLSEGMKDILVDTLVETNRYTVLTRKDLGAVLSELDIQRDAHFRKEGKLKQDKLKNVQYLIKGAVTDFTHTKGSTLRVLGSNLFGIGGSGQVAVVSVTIYVINVESGEIIASKTMEGSATAGSVDFTAEYRDVVIGGNAFFRTPLGKATQDVMEQCLEHISRAIATEQWYPSVVKVEGARMIISGGKNRHLEIGSQWSAREEGEQLVDPKTGDILGHEPGKLSGMIRVTEVNDKYSVTKVLEGTFKTGQILWPAPLDNKKNKASIKD